MKKRAGIVIMTAGLLSALLSGCGLGGDNIGSAGSETQVSGAWALRLALQTCIWRR